MNPPCDGLTYKAGDDRVIKWVNTCGKPSVQRVGAFYYCEKHKPEIEELKEASK